MKLIRQLVEKKLESYQNYSIKKYTIRYIWQFYQAVNLCVSFLKINGIQTLSDSEIKNRNKLYNKIFVKRSNKVNHSKKMQEYMNQDLEIITLAFEVADNLDVKNTFNKIDFEKDEFIGLLASEVEELI